MRQAILIVTKDLRRRLRNPAAVISMMLIPVVITLLIGLVFGGSGDVELPRIRVLLVVNDDALFSHFLRQSMQQERFAELIELVEVEGDEVGATATVSGRAKAAAPTPSPRNPRGLPV